MRLNLNVFYQELCTSIIPYIQKKYFEQKSIETLGITINGVDKSCNFIRITFPSATSTEFSLTLRYLEKYRNLRFRIGVLKNTIIITEDESFREEKEVILKLLHLFMSSLPGRVKDFQTFNLLTPVTIAITADPLPLRIEVSSADGALQLYNSTDMSWNPRLEKERILHIDVPKESLAPYSKGKLLLCRPKEIVTIAGEDELPKVIPIETVYGTTIMSPDGLTEKEVLILQLICKQLTSAEIAREMRLSIRTIEGYRDDLLDKLKVKNVVGLAIYAIKNNLYLIEDEPTINLKDVS